MSDELKIKGKFYPLNHEELLSIARANLTRFEILVLYYIRTLDPFSDGVEVSASQIAKDLSTKEKQVCRQTVSRALKKLDRDDYIDLEIVRAVVKLSGKGHLVSANTNGVCTHHEEPTDTTRCEETPQGTSTHHEKRADTTDIYIEHARAKTSSDFNSNSSQTEEDCAAATEVEILDAEIQEEEVSSTSLATIPEPTNGHHKNEPLGGDKSSAAADADLLREIEAIAHSWRKRPWRLNSAKFKQEMIEAVYKSNPGWYSIEGTAVPNEKRICDRLENLERQLKQNSELSIKAYEELNRYWRLASFLNEPAAKMSPAQVKSLSMAAQIYESIKDL